MLQDKWSGLPSGSTVQDQGSEKGAFEADPRAAGIRRGQSGSSLAPLTFGQELVHGGSADARGAFDGAFVAIGRQLADERVQLVAQCVISKLVTATLVSQRLQGR